MKAIELFAGAGGLGMGVSRAGFRPLKIVERDRWCCDTLRENRDNKVDVLASWPAPIEGDVRDVDFTPHEGSVTVVTGGPPCQPFSLGGKHKGHRDERDMWSEAVRAVRETRPKAFVFENVKGLTRETFATYLAYIVHQLTYPDVVRSRAETWNDHLGRLEKHHTAKGRQSTKYNVVFRVLNAADYGVPQRRQRVVFVGFRSDISANWRFPEPTHSLDALLWQQCKTEEYWERHHVPLRARDMDGRLHVRGSTLLFKPHTKPWRTVRDAISDLPDPETHPGAAGKWFNHKFQPGARSYTGHTGSPLDEPAKTLKAGVHGVPGGENMLVKPDGTVRYFTVRESARLQTFPDEYRFHGAWSEAMRQLGNAVPVELATVIAKAVKEHLKVKSVKGRQH